MLVPSENQPLRYGGWYSGVDKSVSRSRPNTDLSGGAVDVSMKDQLLLFQQKRGTSKHERFKYQC